MTKTKENFQKLISKETAENGFTLAFIDLIEDLFLFESMTNLQFDKLTQTIKPNNQGNIKSATTTEIILPVKIKEVKFLAEYTGNIQFLISNDSGETYDVFKSGETKTFSKEGKAFKFNFRFLDNESELNCFSILGN